MPQTQLSAAICRSALCCPSSQVSVRLGLCTIYYVAHIEVRRHRGPQLVANLGRDDAEPCDPLPPNNVMRNLALWPLALTLLFGVAQLAPVNGHGFLSQPRARGAYWTQRPVGNIVSSESVVGPSGWSYCPHCQNGGGTSRLRNIGANTKNGFFRPYKPMEGMFREGVSQCGDRTDRLRDHSATGRYRSPPGKPYSAEIQAGSVANFEFDFTTPHGGCLSFYLCDVSETGDLTRQTFSDGNCYMLERAYNAACESGNDSQCGPIDRDFPGRWYMPCRVSDARDQDMIIGGASGKMSYVIPNVRMEKAVIMVYWLTSNSCSPVGLEKYYANGGWHHVKNSKCRGDGGTIGGYRRDHTGTCQSQQGKFPEEFWNCADVKIIGGDSGRSTPQYVQKPQEAPNKVENYHDYGKTDVGNGPSDGSTYASGGWNVDQNGDQRSFRAGCLPTKEEGRSDEGYLSYYKALENYCRK